MIPLKLTLNIITVVYKGTNTEVFKCAELNNGKETEMWELDYKTTKFKMTPEEEHRAEELGVYIYGELNAEGFDELNRFLSYVDDLDFLETKYKTQKIEV